MISVELVLRLIGGIFLLLSNGFFVTTEFALTRVRQFEESEFLESSGLEKAWEMTKELEIYLSGCQVGITISSIGLGIVAEPAVTKLFSTLFHLVGITSTAGHTTFSVIIAFSFINILHVIIGEQVPTYLGVERTKTISKYFAPLLYYWVFFFNPVIKLADKISKLILSLLGVQITRSWTEDDGVKEITEVQNIRNEMSRLLKNSNISPERQWEVLNAFDIGEIPVENIMVPIEEATHLEATDEYDDIVSTLQTKQHTRYPIVDTSEDAYIGLVYSVSVLENIDELKSGEKNVDDLDVTLPIVSPDTPVSDVIDLFQASEQEMALVANSKRTEAPVKRSEVVGIVTATDTFERIAGELKDPFDN